MIAPMYSPIHAIYLVLFTPMSHPIQEIYCTHVQSDPRNLLEACMLACLVRTWCKAWGLLNPISSRPINPETCMTHVQWHNFCTTRAARIDAPVKFAVPHSCSKKRRALWLLWKTSLAGTQVDLMMCKTLLPGMLVEAFLYAWKPCWIANHMACIHIAFY